MDAAYEKKRKIVKGIVLGIAVIVGLIMCGTAVLGYHYYTTGRPARDLFGVPGPPVAGDFEASPPFDGPGMPPPR